ncbi:hypothetical protein llap_5233 [Limosa lapponica baueri]|uniref:Uncharacterized protein n=1 Tax=Limosa lapponica baueri TaxID=1758121 RepID=A0A2I0UEH8_LIMLA|nr:hypothetical protein llap_5233 [Limosa lapponica baueri]
MGGLGSSLCFGVQAATWGRAVPVEYQPAVWIRNGAGNQGQQGKERSNDLLGGPFSLSSSHPQFKLKRALVPTLQPETRRSGFQNTSNPQLTTKSDGEDWPRRPLRKKKKKIEESGRLQGKSNVKCQQNCINSGEEPQQTLAGAALPRGSGVWHRWLTPWLGSPR